MELKWFKAKRVYPKTVLHVTQNKIGDDGKAGTIDVAGVDSLGIVADRMCGYDGAGRLVVMLPLSEVAVAIVSET